MVKKSHLPLGASFDTTETQVGVERGASLAPLQRETVRGKSLPRCFVHCRPAAAKSTPVGCWNTRRSKLARGQQLVEDGSLDQFILQPFGGFGKHVISSGRPDGVGARVRTRKGISQSWKMSGRERR